jgi:hypothetical protein
VHPAPTSPPPPTPAVPCVHTLPRTRFPFPFTPASCGFFLSSWFFPSLSLPYLAHDKTTIIAHPPRRVDGTVEPIAEAGKPIYGVSDADIGCGLLVEATIRLTDGSTRILSATTAKIRRQGDGGGGGRVKHAKTFSNSKTEKRKKHPQKGVPAPCPDEIECISTSFLPPPSPAPSLFPVLPPPLYSPELYWGVTHKHSHKRVRLFFCSGGLSPRLDT